MTKKIETQQTRKAHPNRRQILAGAGAGLTLAGLSAPALVHAAEPIRIGFLSPLSQALAFVGQTNLNCINLAVDEINASGGVLGRPLEIIPEDTQMSTKTSVEKARKLVSRDGASMITGMVLPSEREAVLSVAKRAGTLVMHPNGDEGRCDPNLVTTGLGVNQMAAPVANWLAQNKGKTMFVVASDIGSVRNVMMPLVTKAFEAGGGQIVEAQYFPFGTRDYAPVLQQIKNAKPDIVLHNIGDDPITFVKQFHDFGVESVLTTTLTHESIAAATEGASIGAIGFSSYFMSADTAQNTAFKAAYTKAYPEFTQRRVLGDVPILPMGEATYTAMMAYRAAAEAAGGLDLDAIKSALGNLTLPAPRGEVRFDIAKSRALCSALIAECQADNSFDIKARLDPAPAVCS